MQELTPLIYDLAIMLGVAAIVTLLFQRIRQPVVLGYLVAGMIIGPYTPPFGLVSNIEDIKTLSELGVIFLMFSLGLEFSFHKLIRVGFSASITGLLEVVIMLFLGYGIGIMLGWPQYDSLFLGAALSISSTTIIIKAIDELKLKSKQFAHVVFGVLIAEDLLAILLLVALSRIVLTGDAVSFDMFFAGMELIVIVGSWFIVGYFLVPSLFRKISKFVNDETLIILSVALCLFLVMLAAYLHYSTALGAFIMGSILAETVLVRKIERLIIPVRDIFGAVFFVSVGMLIDPVIIAEQWPIVILIAMVTLIGKITSTGLGVLLTGQQPGEAVRAGFSMAQIGEFSFIIVALGLSLGVIGSTLYPVIVAVSVVTTFTTPYLIRFSGPISDKFEKSLSSRARHLLMKYASWLNQVRSTPRQKSLLHYLSPRLFINGILVAIIFTLIDRYIFPRLIILTNHLAIANILSLFLALACASPFIWGMLFSYKMVLPKRISKSAFNPVIFAVWFITIFEVGLFNLIYFPSWSTLFIFFILAVVSFVAAFRQLEKSYAWLEQQFIGNIGQGEQDLRKFEELAPWNTALIEITINEYSPVAGKTLDELRIRQYFGVNIVAIVHGHRVISSPRGGERVMPHDRLIVLGNEEQIERFREHAESSEEKPLEIGLLSNFVLITLLLEPGHSLIGKTIRESGIREQHAIVVGIERDKTQILNPDPEAVLKENDLLFIVVESDGTPGGK